MFVYVSNHKVTCIYCPESILIDKELFQQCSTNLTQQNDPNIEFVLDGLVTLRDKQGLRSTISLNPMALKLVSLLEKPNVELEEKMQKGLKLARFLKN